MEYTECRRLTFEAFVFASNSVHAWASRATGEDRDPATDKHHPSGISFQLKLF
jgi:hypothetical protein